MLSFQPDRGSNITMAGTVMGTPGYMAPGTDPDHKQDERVDQYALGCLLYEMLVGQPVFEANGPMTLMLKHAADPVTPPRERLSEVGSPGLPDSLDALVCRLLSKEPRERFRIDDRACAGAGARDRDHADPAGERTVVPTALVQSISQPPASLPPQSLPPAAPPPTPPPTLRACWAIPSRSAFAGLVLIAVAMGGALWGLRQRGPGAGRNTDDNIPSAELLSLRRSAGFAAKAESARTEARPARRRIRP